MIPEAFSAGTPVVAYPSGGIPEVVRHGDTGLLTVTREPQALAAALSELLDNPALAGRLSFQGRSEWDARFRLDRWQSEICSFIEGDLPATSERRSVQQVPMSADDIRRAAP